MANMRHLRRQNERRVVTTMLRLGDATRGDLARETRMSQPTVGRIVESLLNAQTLTEAEDNERTVVKPGDVLVTRTADGTVESTADDPKQPSLF